MSSVVVIEPPAELVVSLEEAKKHLSVDFDDDDDYITGLVGAAIANIDGPSGWLEQCLVSQTLEIRLDEFDPCGICLKYPPISEIVSVKYDDEAGVEQTLDEAIYRLTGTPRKPRLTLAYGKSWPSVRQQVECIRIQYVAGFGDSPEDVPQSVRHAILILVGHWYANREPVSVGAIVSSIPMTVDALLAPLRIY